MMEKLIYLLGDAAPGTVPRNRSDLRATLLKVGPALARAGALRASFAIADLNDSGVDRIPQFNATGLIDAKVSLWLESVDGRSEIEALLLPLASRCAGYLVTESVPLKPENFGAGSGLRFPGVALVTTFPKPDRIDDTTFYARWHESHTPLSLEIHPLLQYTRNSVARILTPDAPALRAIVSESVESVRVLADPVNFFGNERNRERAVEDLLSFVDFPSLSTVVMSEYMLGA